MFGSNALEVFIGLVFVYFILSLFCSAAMEAFAGLFRLRAKTLEAGIRNLLSAGSPGKNDAAGNLAERFFSHTLIAPLCRWNIKGEVKRKPSYIPSKTFALALLDTVLPGGGQAGLPLQQAWEAVEKLPDEHPLRAPLVGMLKRAGGQVDLAQKQLEGWFDAAMDRVQGWYKRKASLIMFLIALVVVGATNADTFGLFRTLSADAGIRAQLVEAASKVVAANPPDMDAIEKAVEEQLTSGVEASIPFGWAADPMVVGTSGPNVVDVLLKVFGLLVTVLMATLGAPFWFEFLSKLVNLRGAGAKPVTT